ncbi:MAG: nucleotide exchange factor GrpE [Deltaproteobacteria bacterium]|nr:nucleotide exchange factor GrpE [Deltaproteobacteria bacterium]
MENEQSEQDLLSEQDLPPAKVVGQSQDPAQSEGEDKEPLLAKLAEKEAEAKANLELFIRERAELENFKRRMQREQADSIRFANEPLLRDLLPVLDNLNRAVSHAQSGSSQSLVDGVTLVGRSFLETLEKYGVVRIMAKGETFDPTRHEAMAQVENAEVAPNSVVDEYCPAYLLHGRLLRPALVTVAKAPVVETKIEE